MTHLHRDLQEIIAQWRRASEEAQLASAEVSNRFAQGHLSGMSVALDNAAKRIEALLIEDYRSTQSARTPQKLPSVRHAY